MEKYSIFNRIFNAIYYRIARRNSSTFEKFLKYKGCKIGNNCSWGPAMTINIDFSRPSLVEIGDNVRINMGFTLMTHDASNMVLRKVFHEFIPSSGRVKIGNNVYFGRYCTVLKGVTIGNNCIIGYGSIVTKDIPSNSVAIGRPAKIVCTLEEYYEKRKNLCVNEALDYARSINERFGRRPKVSDFWEEFPLFMKGNETSPEVPIELQLKESYEYYKANNKPIFESFEDFLIKAGL